MKDPYRILGVGRDANQDTIKRAYRRRARELHPDLDPGNPRAEEAFKDLSAAYDILSGPGKKALYDTTGRTDGPGRAKAGAKAGPRTNPFERFFRHRHRQRSDFKVRGANVSYSLRVDFLDAAKGATRRVTMRRGKTLDVQIPPGTEDGQVLRLKAQGMPGIGAEAGDAMVEILVNPHPLFEREGHDIHVEVPVTLPEAVLGCRMEVPTIDGPVALTVPEGSNSGTVLRLRGKGLRKSPGNEARGDQYVKLILVLPDKPDKDLVDFVRAWAAEHPYQARGRNRNDRDKKKAGAT